MSNAVLTLTTFVKKKCEWKRNRRKFENFRKFMFFRNWISKNLLRTIWLILMWKSCSLSENSQIVCAILIDFFRPISFSLKKTSKRLFFREFFFIDLSISTKRISHSNYARRKNPNMIFLNNRNRFYDRIFIKNFFFQNRQLDSRETYRESSNDTRIHHDETRWKNWKNHANELNENSRKSIKISHRHENLFQSSCRSQVWD